MTLRFQRLLIIILSLIMILGALLLILYNARENISYFYTPTELFNSKVDETKLIRIGGFVEEKSLTKVCLIDLKYYNYLYEIYFF